MVQLETITIIAFVLCIALFTFFRLEPRIAVAVGLGLLMATATTLALGKGYLADQLAVYAYYFLAVGVIIALMEHLGLVRETWFRQCRAFVTSRLSAVIQHISDGLKMRRQGKQ